MPTNVEELIDFENDMIYMVKNIESRNVYNEFQMKLFLWYRKDEG